MPRETAERRVLRVLGFERLKEADKGDVEEKVGERGVDEAEVLCKFWG